MQNIPDDLPAPLSTRNLLPRSRATSLSRSEVVSAAASRSHSPSSRGSPHLSAFQPMHPPDTDVESQLRSFPAISMNQSDGWGADFTNPAFMADSISMNHHIVGSGSMGFENFSVPQPRRSRKKELFADSEDHTQARPSLVGPSHQPFYNQSQSSANYLSYGLNTMPSLKRKRGESPEPIDSWLNTNPPNQMSIPIDLVDDDDDPAPGPSYISRGRKGKGKETDYKGKGKQREKNPEDSPILISDSPILSDMKPPVPTIQIPSKPLSEPLSSYTCPICFSIPTNATLTPCGHICCGECLFTAVKTVMHRAQQAGAPDAQEARCPVCRALIPDWDGKGAGVIGLKPRAIFSL